MANNYCTTTFILRDKDGNPPQLSALAKALFDLPNGWFEEFSGKGAYDNEWDDREDLLDILRDNNASAEQIAIVEALDDDCCFSVIDVFHLVKNDEGSTLDSIAWEGGGWCDKKRHGEFYGFGGYIGGPVAVGVSSGEAEALGVTLENHLKSGDHKAAAQVLRDALLCPVLQSMTDDDRRKVVDCLADAVKVPF